MDVKHCKRIIILKYGRDYNELMLNNLRSYDDFRSLNIMLAVTFSRIRLLAIESNLLRYLWHCKKETRTETLSIA